MGCLFISLYLSLMDRKRSTLHLTKVSILLWSLLWLLVMAQPVHAQKEASIWYFGQNMGLDFNFIPPRPLTDGALRTSEACASVSDSNGNLLFYSDGVTVYNRKHEVMPNGDSLNGHFSTTQMAVVKKPLSSGSYYLFSIGLSPNPEGLFVSTLDMRLDSGFGDVTTIKNQLLLPNSCEKVTTVSHANQRDVWVLAHKWNSDEIYAFLVTPNGISTTPVVSRTGFTVVPSFIGKASAAGQMKVSPDGAHLAVAHYTIGVSLVLDFDDVTGVASSPIALPYRSACYGVEFSSNGQFLYLGEGFFPTTGRLYQYDLAASDVPASEVLLVEWDRSQGGVNFGSLQLAPDNKIYLSIALAKQVAVINTPNNAGLACDVVLNQFPLLSGSPTLGLPSFNSSLFYKPDFSHSHACTGAATRFTTYAETADSVVWDFDDPQSGVLNRATTAEASHTYITPGTYSVTLYFYRRGTCDTIVREVEVSEAAVDLGSDTTLCHRQRLFLDGATSGATYLWQDSSTSATRAVSAPGLYWQEVSFKGCTSRDTLHVSYIHVPPVSLGADTALCIGEELRLNATAPHVQYAWQDGSKEATFLVEEPGTYAVTLSQQHCQRSDSIKVGYLPLPKVNLGPDQVLCHGRTLSLDASTASASYRWQDGSTEPVFEVVKPGVYHVQVMEACPASDTIVVEFERCPCGFYVPSAFSPNDDEVNEIFQPVTDCDMITYELTIYNRWGELVFRSTEIGKGWTGKVNDHEMPEGVYLYSLDYSSHNYPGAFHRSGEINLVR